MPFPKLQSIWEWDVLGLFLFKMDFLLVLNGSCWGEADWCLQWQTQGMQKLPLTQLETCTWPWTAVLREGLWFPVCFCGMWEFRPRLEQVCLCKLSMVGLCLIWFMVPQQSHRDCGSWCQSLQDEGRCWQVLIVLAEKSQTELVSGGTSGISWTPRGPTTPAGVCVQTYKYTQVSSVCIYTIYSVHPVTTWYYIHTLYSTVYSWCPFLQFAYFHCLVKGMEALSSDPTGLIPDILGIKWGLEIHSQTLLVFVLQICP